MTTDPWLKKRILRVTLEVDVAPLSDEVMSEYLDSMNLTDKEREHWEASDPFDDPKSSDVGDVIADSLDQLSQEMFAGSEIYLQFGKAKVKLAEWVDPVTRASGI